MGGQDRLEVFATKRDTVDDQPAAAVSVRCDTTAQSIVQHSIRAGRTCDMARCQSPLHLLTEPAEGAVGACLAVSGELVAGAATPFLLGSHREPQVTLMTGDDENSSPARVVLELLAHWEVGIPTLITVLHRGFLVWLFMGTSADRRLARRRCLP